MDLESKTKELLAALNTLSVELGQSTDEKIIRELCLKANYLLMRYNLDTWNKLYRETLPKQTERPIIPQETGVEFEMPPV